jgi:hypothetical protein
MTAQTQQTTTLESGPVTGTLVVYNYSTVPGNQPSTYGNTVFLWQTESQAVPVNAAPLASQRIQANTSSGSGAITGVQITMQSYLMAYAVGPEVANIAAVAFIPATGNATGLSMQPEVQVTDVTADGVAYQYAVPAGMQPRQDGDWVGIWETANPSALYTQVPLAVGAVASNASAGSGWLAAQVQEGSTYTLGYFKGGWAEPSPRQTTLACTATFQG